MKIDSIKAFISKGVKRYYTKNTLTAQYERAINRADISFVATAVQIFRFHSWDVADIGLTSMFSTLAIENYRLAINAKKALKPIKARAKHIKKLAKLAKKAAKAQG